MKDLMGMLSELHRPRLLIRAARIGAQDYNRERHLQRILGYGRLPKPAPALFRLMELENEINTQRSENDAGYSLHRHLDLLIAMMGEIQLVQAGRIRPA